MTPAERRQLVERIKADATQAEVARQVGRLQGMVVPLSGCGHCAASGTGITTIVSDD